MVDKVIGNGQTETNTVAPGAGNNLIVTKGATIAVNGANGIFMEGGSLTISGTVIATGANPIRLGDGFTHITIGPTASILGSTGYLSIYAQPDADHVYLTNAGYIGGEFNTNAVGLSQVNDDFSNSGTVVGNVTLQAGNDIFISRGGTVLGKVFGDAGNDTFGIESVKLAAPLLRLDGGTGTDTIDMTAFGAGVWVDLDYGGTNVWTRDNQDLSSGTWRALADAVNMETIYGSSRSDYLSGDAKDNTFGWSTGVDTISGDGGSDTYDLSKMTSAVWIDLDYAGYEAFTQDTAHIVDNGVWHALADLTSVENIVTTTYSDVVSGSGSANTFFYISSMFDQADKFDGRGGSDTADFSKFTTYAVWVNLSYAGVEGWTNLTTDANGGGTMYQITDLANIENLTGTVNMDFLAGDGGANRIEGGKSADVLWGFGGVDTFVYNLAPNDLPYGKDTISDMVAGVDKIGIAGLLSLPTIVSNDTPLPSAFGPTLLYETDTGILSYDADGNGAGSAVELAQLLGKPALTASDFILV